MNEEVVEGGERAVVGFVVVEGCRRWEEVAAWTAEVVVVGEVGVALVVREREVRD